MYMGRGTYRKCVGGWIQNRRLYATSILHVSSGEKLYPQFCKVDLQMAGLNSSSISQLDGMVVLDKQIHLLSGWVGQ